MENQCTDQRRNRKRQNVSREIIIKMKRGHFFTPCADCIFHVGGECAEGRGQTADNDGCTETYFYDCNINEPMPTVPKRFVKFSEPLTAEKLIFSGGWKVENENNFGKMLGIDINDEEFITIRFYHRNGVKTTQIDITRGKVCEMHVAFRRDITVGEFNNAVALVGLDQLKI